MHSNYLGTWFIITMGLALIFLILLATKKLFKPALFSKIMFCFLVVAGPWFILGTVLGMVDLSSDFSQTSEYAVNPKRQLMFGRTTTAPSILALVPLFTIGSLGVVIDVLLLRGTFKKRKSHNKKTY